MEKIKINVTSKDFFHLEGLNRKFTHIARDEDGTLNVFERSPSKGKGIWSVFWDYESRRIHPGFLSDIRWENGRSYTLDEIKRMYREGEKANVTNR